jgi:hypothetical protein
MLCRLGIKRLDSTQVILLFSHFVILYRLVFSVVYKIRPYDLFYRIFDIQGRYPWDHLLSVPAFFVGEGEDVAVLLHFSLCHQKTA